MQVIIVEKTIYVPSVTKLTLPIIIVVSQELNLGLELFGRIHARLVSVEETVYSAVDGTFGEKDHTKYTDKIQSDLKVNSDVHMQHISILKRIQHLILIFTI